MQQHHSSKKKRPRLKRRPNPYIYLLLKELFYREMHINGNPVTQTDKMKYVYQRVVHSKSPSRHYIFKYNPKRQIGSKDAEAMTVAEAMKENFMKPKDDYILSLLQLDRLSQILSWLGEYDDWNDFVDRFKEDQGAIAAEKYRDVPYSDLSKEACDKIMSWVYRRLETIVNRAKYAGKLTGVTYKSVLENTGEYIVRTVNENELSDVMEALNEVKEASAKNYYLKEPWLNKNPYIFYVYMDFYDQLGGVLSVLPITENCYQKLKKGHIHETEISETDILSDFKKAEVRHLYIEELNCNNKYAFWVFIQCLTEAISSLADIANDNLVIAATGSDDDRKHLIQVGGFKPVSKTTKPDTGQQEVFNEITWTSLKNNLSSVHSHDIAGFIIDKFAKTKYYGKNETK